MVKKLCSLLVMLAPMESLSPSVIELCSNHDLTEVFECRSPSDKFDVIKPSGLES